MTFVAKIRDRISGFGIQVKLAGTVALCAAIALAIGFNFQLAGKKATLEADLVKNAGLISHLVAGQLGPSTKFMDGTRISATFKPVVEQDTAIVAVDVIHFTEGSIATYDIQEERLAGVSALFETAHESLLNGDPASTFLNADFAVAATPITSTSSSKPVGYYLMAWDLAPVHAVAFAEALQSLAISGFAAVLALIMIVFMVGRMVTRPVLHLGTALETISNRNYDIDIPSAGRRDEIGQIARSLEHVRTKLQSDRKERELRADEDQERQKLFKRLATGLSEIADGHIDRPIDIAEFEDLDDSHKRICHDFNGVLTNLKSVLSTVMTTAESVRSSALEISESVVDQSKRSEAQAVTLEESAAAIETLSSSVEQTAEHAAEANDLITQNRQQAQSGGEVVELTVEAMRNIEQSSQEISAIIGVIDDIGFQTNLLALNAGVEAARAGEAGRGFAVVASEVRALAQRASESANEIKELISRSEEQVTNGGRLVNKAGDALQEIIKGVNHASDLVSQIATGSRDQADNLLEIKESVTELDRVTQRNAAMIEESSAASRNLSDEASKMTGALKAFKLSAADAEQSRQSVSSWDNDLANDHSRKPSGNTSTEGLRKSGTRPSPKQKTASSKNGRTQDFPRSKPAENSPKRTAEKEQVLTFKRSASTVKVAVNQAPAMQPSEDWEDF